MMDREWRAVEKWEVRLQDFIFEVLVIIKGFLAQGFSFSLFDVEGWVAMLCRTYEVHILLQ